MPERGLLAFVTDITGRLNYSGCEYRWCHLPVVLPRDSYIIVMRLDNKAS